MRILRNRSEPFFVIRTTLYKTPRLKFAKKIEQIKNIWDWQTADYHKCSNKHLEQLFNFLIQAGIKKSGTFIQKLIFWVFVGVSRDVKQGRSSSFKCQWHVLHQKSLPTHPNSGDVSSIKWKLYAKGTSFTYLLGFWYFS